MQIAAQFGVQTRPSLLLQLFAAAFGALVGLGLLKFGNPVILDKLVGLPGDIYEWALMPWPIRIGYWVLGAVCFLGILCVRLGDLKICGPALLLLVWLGWQLIAATQTVNATLTGVTLKHFTACVVCFWLGYIMLARMNRPNLFFLGLSCGFALALAMGVDQRFGGLEDTRRHFWLYVYPELSQPPPELLKRMASDRIFATLFYPNTFAGAILLCLPVVLAFLWQLKRQFTPAARAFLMGLFALAGTACMVWTGSKGGWLVALTLCLIGVLRIRFARRLKIGLVVVALAIGLGGFGVRFAHYFKRGATSVVARFDYWEVAALACSKKPLFGTGPGTFEVTHATLKRPESEMARSVHNDYLQQASDSGLPGFVLYVAFIVGSLRAAYPKPVTGMNGLAFGAWLGVLGWSIHNLIEFGLYIPALSWPVFALIGWLVGRKLDLVRQGQPKRLTSSR